MLSDQRRIFLKFYSALSRLRVDELMDASSFLCETTCYGSFSSHEATSSPLSQPFPGQRTAWDCLSEQGTLLGKFTPGRLGKRGQFMDMTHRILLLISERIMYRTQATLNQEIFQNYIKHVIFIQLLS